MVLTGKKIFRRFLTASFEITISPTTTFVETRTNKNQRVPNLKTMCGIQAVKVFVELPNLYDVTHYVLEHYILSVDQFYRSLFTSNIQFLQLMTVQFTINGCKMLKKAFLWIPPDLLSYFWWILFFETSCP